MCVKLLLAGLFSTSLETHASLFCGHLHSRLLSFPQKGKPACATTATIADLAASSGVGKDGKAAQAKPSGLSQTSHKILHISKALHAQPKKTTQGF
ncbi:hypothetical protein HMPREF0322_01542 [Desulfitobacterium hafniense DP7]|uniref:Secreted protein n=1 Tax=Desulfitobacterium hafniense DP7 TaxID=537010 RepID=G9XKQ9_DESHA|nr:hypothetical protein HMPREF0322_01542 [Desulfitobacterium hafniense DP7]